MTVLSICENFMKFINMTDSETWHSEVGHRDILWMDVKILFLYG